MLGVAVSLGEPLKLGLCVPLALPEGVNVDVADVDAVDDSEDELLCEGVTEYVVDGVTAELGVSEAVWLAVEVAD